MREEVDWGEGVREEGDLAKGGLSRVCKIGFYICECKRRAVQYEWHDLFKLSCLFQVTRRVLENSIHKTCQGNTVTMHTWGW